MFHFCMRLLSLYALWHCFWCVFAQAFFPSSHHLAVLTRYLGVLARYLGVLTRSPPHNNQ